MEYTSNKYPISVQDNLKVIVIVFVYNHEPYLRTCLDAFVSQKTSFDFCVLVHDDCSTDGSADIIIEYASMYPDIIMPVLQEENQYSKGVYVCGDLIRGAKTKYLAMCEGDDYWCDSLKLQKQYDYMEKNNGCSLCVHRTWIHDMRGKAPDTVITEFEGESRSLSPKEVFDDWMVHSSSYFFRNDYDFIPEWSRFYWSGDYALICIAYAHGSVDMLPDVMSVYNYGRSDGVTQTHINSDSDTLMEKVYARKVFLEAYLDHLKIDPDANTIVRNRIDSIEEYRVRHTIVKRLKEYAYDEKDDKERLLGLMEAMNEPVLRKACMDPSPGVESANTHAEWMTILKILKLYLNSMEGITYLLHLFYLPWMVHYYLEEKEAEYLAGISASPYNEAGWGVLMEGHEKDAAWRKQAMLQAANRCRTEEDGSALEACKEQLRNLKAVSEEEWEHFGRVLSGAMEYNYLDPELLFDKAILRLMQKKHELALDEIGIFIQFYGETDEIKELYQTVLRDMQAQV